MPQVPGMNKDNLATVTWGDQVYTGPPTRVDIRSDARSFTKVIVEFVLDETSAREDDIYATGMVGDKNNPYTISADSINISSEELAKCSLSVGGYDLSWISDSHYDEESDEMTKNVEYVYIPYAINQRTKETWEGDRVTGDDYQATVQRVILENAYNINMLGDSDDIYVWLGEVGKFEPIE